MNGGIAKIAVKLLQKDYGIILTRVFKAPVSLSDYATQLEIFIGSVISLYKNVN